MAVKQQSDRKALESLYVLNKQAKKYRDKASNSYHAGKKATARKNSCRKGAMYGVKERVLRKIHQQAIEIRLHEINGDDFYCLYFKDKEGQRWSFHAPTSKLDIDENRVEGKAELDDFKSDSEKEATSRSLKDSLLYIESEFGLNANNYLDDKYVDYGRNSYFIGWKYLGD
jgi:hypothetical protein